MRADYREEPCRTALNPVRGMDFNWSLNPYTGCAHRCAFCYVRGFERRADRPSDDRYGASVRVKVNVADVLRTELASRSWKRETVVIGAATDPYQPVEGRYRLTRQCIVELARARTPLGIITRGPLVVRDIDVLKHAATRGGVKVHVSVPTLDERVWRLTEPGTAPPLARLHALRRLVDAGIDAGVGMAPVLPGLSDRPDQLEAVIRAARDAGATRIWTSVLYLPPGVREHFMSVLQQHWPEERERYEKLYAARAHLRRRDTEYVIAEVARLRSDIGVRDRRPVRLKPPPEPEQLDLAI